MKNILTFQAYERVFPIKNGMEYINVRIQAHTRHFGCILGWLKIARKVFSIELHVFFAPFVLNFIALYDAYTIYRQYVGLPKKSSIYSLLLDIFAGSTI